MQAIYDFLHRSSVKDSIRVIAISNTNTSKLRKRSISNETKEINNNIKILNPVDLLTSRDAYDYAGFN